ncbi:hypothetical protein [Chitinophaga solisilvae]|uniref:hypothetical protein n=1 Tax=Chitinophaga solisilvae TaxID=1233460 RepID=UPI0013683EE8|nr:hypothetical protein [Chitinophaga solisilvae]
MRTTLCEIQAIEQYLDNTLPVTEHLLFQARTLAAPELAEKVNAQEKVLQLVRWFSRKKKKEKLDQLFNQLMQEESFHHSITTIFT